MKRLIIIAGIFFLIGCQPRQTVKTVSPEEEFLTQPVITDSVTVIRKEPEQIQPRTEEQVSPQTAYGYRVQIFASWSNENAERIANEARMKFPNEKIYVEYIPPLYRVRVGDCKTRAEAESLRDVARSSGYSDAFIVQTNINVQ